MSVNKISTLFTSTLKNSDLSEKQQAVLTACLELFSEQGYENTSTADIAKRARVAEGTVYKHFKTKQEILNAILKPMTDTVVPEVAAEFVDQIQPDQFTSLEALLRFVVADRLQFALDNRAIIRVFAQQAFVRQDLLQKVLTTLNTQFNHGFLPALHQLQARGEMVKWEDVRIFRLIGSTVLGYALPVVMMPAGTSTFDFEKSTNEIVETLSKAFSA
ncbi:TetR/AcrR family transcriptional regulator [Lacticaseibacillus porcinae]|uniref:TetR/AcrR family transcriptional regulator n=1 Tax=Lacticaseibacillus porcinae TaxID=1123687 RepID=UPI000F7869CF|nr:TetR/AcrR family transcriptional regulator [Lacticaseibacillus porcinae]